MRKCIILFMLLATLLTGCSTVDANRIYTVCQIENDISIAYNTDFEFVQVLSDGSIHPHSGAGVTAKPVLSVKPKSGEYVISVTDVPNKYKATLESVEHYIQRLLDEGSEYEVAFISWRELDVYVHNEEWHCRCLWDIDGNLRVYFVDIYNNTMEPLYLNEEL